MNASIWVLVVDKKRHCNLTYRVYIMVTQDTILSLMKRAKNPSISIYLPTHRKGEEVQQDPIRFKNLLTKAEKKLKERHVEPSQTEALLKKARALLNQPPFWQHSDRGLAVFITEGFFKYFRLPLDFTEQLMVEDHFLITPLLPMITLEGSYHILMLSRKNIRLLKCTRDSVIPITLEQAPTNFEAFMKYDVKERHLQHHSGEGKGQTIFHGQGGGEETNEREFENYLNMVENEVTAIMRKREDPLILAGIDETVALYKKVNKYNRLADDSVKTNPDPLSDQQINKKGWALIKTWLLKRMYDDIERFSHLIGSDKQSDNLTQVVQAAHYGKIDTLFVPIGVQSWGRFDADQDRVHHSTKQHDGQHDLINIAAIQTLQKGGDVYALKKQEMPHKTAIAAIFRY